MGLPFGRTVEIVLTTLGRPFFMTFSFKTEARNQGHSGPDAVCDTPRIQAAFTHELCDSYRK